MRQATGERKIYNMLQRNRRDVDFEAGKIEGYVFAMNQRDQGCIPEDEHREQSESTLGNGNYISRFPSNNSFLLGY